MNYEKVQSKPTAGGRQRGAALTELIILILPYALIIIGVIVLGTLAVGKQECQKAIFYAIPQPGEQTWDDIRDDLDPISDSDARAEMDFSEDNDFEPVQDYATEEPVFPLRDWSSGVSENDIHALFVRMGYTATSRTSIQNGTPVTTTEEYRNWMGSYLENHHISSGTGASDQDGYATENNIVNALNEWMIYSSARANFSFAYGGSRLAGENDDSRDPRDTFTLHGQDGEEGITYFSISSFTDDDNDGRADDNSGYGRGTHASSSTMGSPSIDEVGDLDMTIPESGEGTDLDWTALYDANETTWTANSTFEP